jgi:hypothetical protein
VTWTFACSNALPEELPESDGTNVQLVLELVAESSSPTCKWNPVTVEQLEVPFKREHERGGRPGRFEPVIESLVLLAMSLQRQVPALKKSTTLCRVAWALVGRALGGQRDSGLLTVVTAFIRGQ